MTTKTINKTILKEYKKMLLQSFDDGQIQVEFPNDDDLTQVRVVLLPNSGLYEGGRFVFSVQLPEDYPESAPSIMCDTKIFHPNIDYTGCLCFNILSDEWDNSLRLVDYAHALLWLLYQPNLDSRLNGDCPQDPEEFASMVKTAIEGGTVAGETFECALAEQYSENVDTTNTDATAPTPTEAVAPAETPPVPVATVEAVPMVTVKVEGMVVAAPTVLAVD